MEDKGLSLIIEEQIAVRFTGRINILDSRSSQLLGSLELLDGNLVNSTYRAVKGVKSFYNLMIDDFEVKPLRYIVEPELINSKLNNIQVPYKTLKSRLNGIIEQYRESKSKRPAEHLKLLVRPEFISSEISIDQDEFDLLCTIADYAKVEDIYKQSSMLDYEITNGLVSLRKKNALKVVQIK